MTKNSEPIKYLTGSSKDTLDTSKRLFNAKKFVKKVSKNGIPVEKAILFGSHSKKTQTKIAILMYV